MYICRNKSKNRDMNELMNGSRNNGQRMSSVQLVNIINQYRKVEGNNTVLRHIDFMIKIEKELDSDCENFRSEYKSSNNQMYKSYSLPKDECILMLMSESRIVRKGVLAKLNELQSNIPSYQIEDSVLRAEKWIIEQKEMVLLQDRNTILEPRSKYFEQMIQTDGLVSMEQCAKLLNMPNMGRNNLYKALRSGGVIQKSNTSPLQHFVNKGYFELKEEIIEINKIRKVNVTTYVTQKGMAFIFKFFGLTNN